MKRELLSKAIGEIDEFFIAEACLPAVGEAEPSQERSNHMKLKRLIPLALAAALILSLGVVAYAVWGIHTARQQELRDNLKIDENHAESYVEYSVAEEQNAGVVLLSAVNDGEEQRLYVNVSPVTREEAAGFPERTDFYWSIKGTEARGFAAPRLPVELSLSGHDAIREAVLQYAYDEGTQTMTLECYLMSDLLKRTLQELGSDTLPLQLNLSVDGQPRCFGTIPFSPTEEQRRVFDFNHQLYYDSELDKEIEIVALELTPFSAVWQVSYPEAAEYHTPTADQSKYRDWSMLEDKVCIDSRLHFSDGSTFTTGGALTTPYKDGVVNLYCGWGSAIDIQDVQRITIGDQILWEAPANN